MKWLIVLVVILSACSAASAQAPQGREAPRELAQQITTQLDECRNALPLTPEVAGEVRDVITNFDFKKPDTMSALREKILAVGPGTIPVVDDFLQSQDDSLREKAVFALRCLVSNVENTPTEKTSVDVLLAKLFHRTVFDKSPRVRESAIIGLGGLGNTKYGDNPEVLLGLQEALNDPDPKLRTYVERTIEALEKTREDSGTQQ